LLTSAVGSDSVCVAMSRFIVLAIGCFLVLSTIARVIRGFRGRAAGGVVCPACSRRNPRNAVACVFCGAQLRRERRVPEYTVED